MTTGSPSIAMIPALAGLEPKLKERAADLAVLATAAAVLCLFAISPITLEHFGFSYLTPGGGPFSKVHPATVMGSAALLLRCYASSRPLRTFWSIGTRDGGAVILMIAVALTAVYAVFIAKTPVTPLIDSFIAPVIFFMLLRDLDPKIVKWLALLVAIVFCINAAMAMYEFFGHTHVVTLPVLDNVSSDPTRGDAIFDWRAELMQDWRATALLGHPLSNGLIVGCLIICLAAPGSRWLPGSVRWPLLVLQCASMFAFGARASLVLTILLGCALAIQQWRDNLRRGLRVAPRDVAIVLIFLAIIVGFGLLAYSSGILDKTIDRFTSDDGSARTRTTMLQMFQPLSWTDIVLGPSQEVVATWQRLNGLEFGIESSWIGLALAYGLLITGFLVIGLLAFLRSVVQATGRGAMAVLLFLLISVSVTASLSGKTISLAVTVTLVLLYLRKDERCRPLRDVLSVKTV